MLNEIAAAVNGLCMWLKSSNGNGRVSQETDKTLLPCKIAYLIGHLKTGGTQRHLVEVISRLDRARFAPQVYCLKRQGEVVGDIERLGVNVVDLAIGQSIARPKTLLSLIKFARRLRREGIAVLHCYLPRANLLGVVAGKIAGVPSVLISKRSLENSRNFEGIRIFRLADKWADAVLVNSREVWRDAVEVGGCRPEKLRLLVNGIDIDRYRKVSNNGLYPEEPVVGTVLRLEAIKGPDVFIEVAKRVLDKMPRTRFIIVGDGSMRAGLERLGRVLGISDRIQYLGKRDDVDAILPSFSIFILPSLAEGMSMALLEAMAAARPIIATAVGGNLDVIRDGENGLLIPPRDPDAMARAVLQLLNDPALGRRLGKAAQAVVVKHHSAHRMVRRLEGIYEDMLRQKRHEPRNILSAD